MSLYLCVSVGPFALSVGIFHTSINNACVQNKIESHYYFTIVLFKEIKVPYLHMLSFKWEQKLMRERKRREKGQWQVDAKIGSSVNSCINM